MAGDSRFKNDRKLVDGYTVVKYIGYIGLAGLALFAFMFGILYVSDAIQAPRLYKQIAEKDAEIAEYQRLASISASSFAEYAVNVAAIHSTRWDDDPAAIALNSTRADVPADFETLAFDHNAIPLNSSALLTFNVKSLSDKQLDNVDVNISLIPTNACNQYFKMDGIGAHILPILPAKNAQSGDITVTFTAVAVPAKAVTCEVDGTLSIEGQNVTARRLLLTAYNMGDE